MLFPYCACHLSLLCDTFPGKKIFVLFAYARSRRVLTQGGDTRLVPDGHTYWSVLKVTVLTLINSGLCLHENAGVIL